MKPTIEELTPSLFYIPPKSLDRANPFFNVYDMERYIPCPPIEYGALKKKKERVCRFCGKNATETTFIKKSHFFPELLGNRYLMSDFECDACNFNLSKYENDLANYFGLTRTLHIVRGKEKVPKFKSSKNTLVLDADASQNTVTISRENMSDQSILFDEESGQILVKHCCHPYTPLRVYKAILKMALSAINEKEVQDYPAAYKYIASDEMDNHLGGSKILSLCTLPLTWTFQYPIGMLFRKRFDESPFFTHVFCLYFQNNIFQTVIPLRNQDIIYHNRRKMQMPVCPILCPNEESANEIDNMDITWHEVDLSSQQIKKDDWRTMQIPVDREYFNNLKKEYAEIGKILHFDRISEIGISKYRI